MDLVRARRLTVNCAVPFDHPDPQAVRRRVDGAAERLGAALGEILAPLTQLGDEVIAIKQLEIGCELDTSLPPDELAAAWAARIAAAVVAWLRPEARASMVRFADQAHYLARFLADSVAGHAETRWYYRRWDGFAALALPARLRSALVEDPARGLAALAALPAFERTGVLAALGAREARRVVEAVLADGADHSAGEIEAAARALAPHVSAWLPIATALGSAWQAGLALAALALAAAGAAATSSGLVAAAVARLPSELRALVALAAALGAAALDPQLRAGAVPSARALLDGAGLPSPAPLLVLTAPARRALLAPLGAADTTPAAEPASWYTRLGGLLLLLPRLAELPLDELFGDDAGCARLHVLARCAGSARRAEVLADPLWRRLCGAGVDREDVGAWSPPAEVAERCAAALWHRAAGRARGLRAVVTRGEQPLLVVASEPDGDWLGMVALTPELRAALRRSSAVAIEALELSARVSIATGQAAACMLAWLAPRSPDARDSLELALTLAAQHALRAFARRLPGFAESSPRFLYNSFLDFDATVLETEDAFHCRVGRPPLSALFGLTGALRGRLPIGGGRALELYPA